MLGHLSTEPMTHIVSVSSRLAGQQAAVDQRYISQQRISGTSVSTRPAVHQSAEDQWYISQHRTSCKVHQSAEDLLHISWQRTNSY